MTHSFSRMLQSGDDPLYIARRVVRFASEDVGLADPAALVQAVAAYQACASIGMPECKLAVLQAVAYCARAPKSIALEDALHAAQVWFDYLSCWVDLILYIWQEVINEFGALPVPIHLRNAETKLMKSLNYGKWFFHYYFHPFSGKDYIYNPVFSPSDERVLSQKFDTFWHLFLNLFQISSNGNSSMRFTFSHLTFPL